MTPPAEGGPAPLVDVLIEAPEWESLDLAGLAERAGRAVLARLGLPAEGFEICVLAGSDVRIAGLNADFRGKPQPTNVLSWPAEERGAAVEGARPAPPVPGRPEDPEALGDIALAHGVCAAEAAAAGRPLADHVTHLIVHGTLHLLGYDHQRDGDAAVMEGLEVEILASMGLPDPYEDPATVRIA